MEGNAMGFYRRQKIIGELIQPCLTSAVLYSFYSMSPPEGIYKNTVDADHRENSKGFIADPETANKTTFSLSHDTARQRGIGRILIKDAFA
jgi:hypothetical protein